MKLDDILDFLHVINPFNVIKEINEYNEEINKYKEEKPRYEKPMWSPNEIFQEGFARVEMNGKWNFKDTNGNLLSPNQWFDDCCSFFDGFGAVKLNGKWFRIDKLGNLRDYDCVNNSRHYKNFISVRKNWDDIMCLSTANETGKRILRERVFERTAQMNQNTISFYCDTNRIHKEKTKETIKSNNIFKIR